MWAGWTTLSPMGESVGPDGTAVLDDEVASAATDESAPKETKGERTQRRLLEIAIERFGERGFRATSVSEVARAAGLTQAAVYAYFPNKEALFDAAVDADATRLIDEARQQAKDAAATQLAPMLLLFLVGGLEQHALVRRVVAGNEPDALGRLVELPALTQLTSAIADGVRAAQETGEVRADLDADMFANGAEAILLSLLMSMTQIGAATVARRQLGVLSIFESVLRPPEA